MSDGLKCEVHPGFDITYMCCTPDCSVFLCAQCIPEHCTKHMTMQAYADIQLLEKVSKDCENKLKQALEKVDVEIANGVAVSAEAEKKCYITLQKAKEDLLQAVNNYFLLEGAKLRDHYDRVRSEGELVSIRKNLQAEYDRVMNHKDAKSVAETLRKNVDFTTPSQKEYEEDNFLVVINNKQLGQELASFLSTYCSTISTKLAQNKQLK
jgi:hypothetical protein